MIKFKKAAKPPRQSERQDESRLEQTRAAAAEKTKGTEVAPQTGNRSAAQDKES